MRRISSWLSGILVAQAFALAAALAVPAQAAEPIARVPPVSEDSTDPIVKAMFDNARSRGGSVINLGLIRGNAPKLAKAGSDLAYAIRFDTKTPRPLVELAILRAVQLYDGHYEIRQHVPMMRACGYSQEQVDAVSKWRRSKLFDDKQRALLAYVEGAARGKVSDRTFAEFAKFFDTQEIVEITITVANYVGTALFTGALKVRTEDDGRLTAIGKC